MSTTKVGYVLLYFLATAVALYSSASVVQAQQLQKSYRIGYLTPFPVPPTDNQRFKPFYQLLEQALAERGYIPGKNLTIEYRTSEGHDERLPGLVQELLRLKVDVLLTVGTPPTRAAQQGTKSTPIVMVTVLDPVAAGFVDALAHPGGNITGSSELAEELVPKRLELVKELIPRASSVAVLWDPTHPTNRLDLHRTEEAARTLNLKIRGFGAHEISEIEAVFSEMRRWHPDAVVVLTSGSSILHMSRIIDLTNKGKLPTIYGVSFAAASGALAGYGPDSLDQMVHAAMFVDEIFKGAKPGDLPIRQPTKFRLAVNLHTAKALGLSIPQSFLLTADDIVE